MRGSGSYKASGHKAHGQKNYDYKVSAKVAILKVKIDPWHCDVGKLHGGSIAVKQDPKAGDGR